METAPFAVLFPPGEMLRPCALGFGGVAGFLGIRAARGDASLVGQLAESCSQPLAQRSGARCPAFVSGCEDRSCAEPSSRQLAGFGRS